MSDFVLVVLKTGEQFVGKRVPHNIEEDSNMDDVIVEQPLQLVRGPQGGMLMDYLEVAEDKQATFYEEDVRHVLTPRDNLVEQWNQKFGAGIQIVGANSPVLG